MRNRSLFRALMIVVGITATFVIVLSQALPDISGSANQKAKTEQTDQDKDVHIVAAPSDVVVGGVIELHDADRFLLETLISQKVETLELPNFIHALSGYFNVLFRAIISPNAP